MTLRGAAQHPLRHKTFQTDEMIHLAGQYTDEASAMPDWALKTSAEHLIGQGRFEQVEAYWHAWIPKAGSGQMQYHNGMVALSRGRCAEGLDRFSRADGDGSVTSINAL